MGSEIYCKQDPWGDERELDDKLFALDHFQVKLLKLPDTMQTSEGKKLAQSRASYILSFMDQMRSELRC